MAWFSKKRPPLGDVNAARYVAQLRSLVASRRAIVEAFEVERHRIERDLHDGTQQYLVASTLKLGEAQLLLEMLTVADAQRGEDDTEKTLAQIATLLEEAQQASHEALTALRHTVTGIHTTVLPDAGLPAAVEHAISTLGLRAEMHAPHSMPEIPPGVASTAYFVAVEALTNAAKYAPDAKVTVLITADRNLRVIVMDSGPGGAFLKPQHGLAGLSERLAAFGGYLEVSSPIGGPTRVCATVPLLLDVEQPNWDMTDPLSAQMRAEAAAFPGPPRPPGPPRMPGPFPHGAASSYKKPRTHGAASRKDLS